MVYAIRSLTLLLPPIFIMIHLILSWPPPIPFFFVCILPSLQLISYFLTLPPNFLNYGAHVVPFYGRGQHNDPSMYCILSISNIGKLQPLNITLFHVAHVLPLKNNFSSFIIYFCHSKLNNIPSHIVISPSFALLRMNKHCLCCPYLIVEKRVSLFLYLPSSPKKIPPPVYSYPYYPYPPQIQTAI